jgi:hypothetical protein
MTISRTSALASLLLLSACDADNVQWAVVSNPGGSFVGTGGAVIVIRVTSTSGLLGFEGDFLRVEGADERGPVSVLLPYDGDFGLLVRANSVEVRSPALSPQDGDRRRTSRFEAQGAALIVPPPGGPAALRVRVPDSSVVHQSGVGVGTLHVARAGTLMILESGSGLVVFGERETPEVVAMPVTLTTTSGGDRYALLRPGTQLRVLNVPPLPVHEQRLVPVPSRNSLRILGPGAEVLAELPSDVVRLEGGAGGVFMRAELPQGLPGDSKSMSLLMAAYNRYLLRIER